MNRRADTQISFGAANAVGADGLRRRARPRDHESVPRSEDLLYGVPHSGGDDLLGGRTGVDDVAGALAQDVHGVVVATERLVDAHLVDHEQVAPLAGQLVAAVVEHAALVVTGLGGEPDDDRVGLLAAGLDQPGEDVGVAHQLDGRGGVGLGPGRASS